MAPNVKESISQLDLSSHRLDELTKNLSSSLPKYLPLTDPSEAEQSTLVAPSKSQIDIEVEVETTHVIENKEKEVESYWDWEQPTAEEAKTKIIEKILKEEECRQAVSTDHIISNLINDANGAAARGKMIENEESEEDGYWDMPAENDVTETEEASIVSVSQIEKLMIEEAARLRKIKISDMVAAAHVKDKTHPLNSYWDWTSAPSSKEEMKAALMKQILNDEAIRVSLTIGSIEHNLKQSICEEKSKTDNMSSSDLKDANNYWYWADTTTLKEASHVQDPSHPNHEYWNFPSKPATDAERKAALIEQILKEESIRQLLSTDHIIRNETTINKSSTQGDDIITPNDIEDESYWNWNHLSEIITAPHVNDCTHPRHSYWDERSEPVDEKAAMIAKILEEESIRQSLSVERIVASMKSQSLKIECCESQEEEKDSFYWDW